MNIKHISLAANLVVVSVLSIAVLLSSGVFLHVAYAAELLNKSDTVTSQKVSELSNHTLVFRTPTGAAENTDTITLEFDTTGTNFTINGSLDFTDLDLAHSAGGQSNCTGVSYTNNETLASSASATEWGVSVNNSTDIITLTAPTDGVGAAAIAANACVQIEIGTHATTGTTGDQQIQNPGSNASYTIRIDGAFGDDGDIVINILTDDQIAITATVDESLTFTINDNAIGFGTLSATNDRFATADATGSDTDDPTYAHNLIIGTNATNGYTTTVNGTTLTAPGGTITAIGSANTATSLGTEQFGLRIDESGGIGAVTAPYAASGYAFDTAAFPDEVASASGPSANTTYSVTYIANIASNTEAGAYTTTLTYVATANF